MNTRDVALKGFPIYLHLFDKANLNAYNSEGN